MADFFTSMPSANTVIGYTTTDSASWFTAFSSVIGWVLAVTVAVAIILFVIRQANRGIKGVTRGGRRRFMRRR